jgi:hypothetical protein
MRHLCFCGHRCPFFERTTAHNDDDQAEDENNVCVILFEQLKFAIIISFEKIKQ